MLCAKSVHETPQQHGSTTACPNHSSFLDRSLILFNCCLQDTLLHIGLPNCITSVPTMYQNTFLWLQHHKGEQYKKERKNRVCTNTTVSHPQSAVIKVRYARVNTYCGMRMSSVVTTWMMFSLPVASPMSSDSSTPPRPDAPQLKDELLKNRIRRCPYHIPSTLASRWSATLPLL